METALDRGDRYTGTDDKDRPKMKLAIVGTGQMGQAVEVLALQRGHEIATRFNSARPLLGADPSDLEGVDAAIDFSIPSLAVDHVKRFCEWNIPAVIGTTGWYERLDDVAEWVDRLNAAVLYAPNFSLGVALLVRALRSLVPLLEDLPEFDAFVHEIHHVRKLDSPSGTATMLGGILVDGLSRKTHVEAETQHGRIDAKALHVTSSRVGGVFGKHTIGLDSPFDSLELIHEAKNRQGFAFGAVRAAEWLKGRSGLFTLDDVLGR